MVNAANLIGYAVGGVLVGPFEPRHIVIGCGVAGLRRRRDLRWLDVAGQRGGWVSSCFVTSRQVFVP